MVAPSVQRFIDCDLPMPRRPRPRSKPKTADVSDQRLEGNAGHADTRAHYYSDGLDGRVGIWVDGSALQVTCQT
jgi:hypothetical protein